MAGIREALICVHCVELSTDTGKKNVAAKTRGVEFGHLVAAFCFLGGARDNNKGTDVIIDAVVSITQNGPLY